MSEPDSLDEQALQEDVPDPVEEFYGRKIAEAFPPAWTDEKMRAELDRLFALYEKEKPF
jgi:hypothetical protein